MPGITQTHRLGWGLWFCCRWLWFWLLRGCGGLRLLCCCGLRLGLRLWSWRLRLLRCCGGLWLILSCWGLYRVRLSCCLILGSWLVLSCWGLYRIRLSCWGSWLVRLWGEPFTPQSVSGWGDACHDLKLKALWCTVRDSLHLTSTWLPALSHYY